MQTNHDSVSKLIFELSKLPGIGEKTATRLSHFIIRQDLSYARALSDALLGAKQKTHLCEICCTFTEQSPCYLCSSASRDATTICVVERPSDVYAIQQAGNFNGLFHVLHGALSPLEGIGPEELKIPELLRRVDPSQVTSRVIREVILATNSSVEGETTALYIAKLIKPIGIQVTQLAHGLPVGGLLEYSDKQTICKALDNRMEIN